MLGFLKEIAKLLSIIITHHHHPLPCLGISRDWMMGGAGSHGVVRAATTTPWMDGWMHGWMIAHPPLGGGGISQPVINHSRQGGVDIMHTSIHPSITSIKPAITPVNFNININITILHPLAQFHQSTNQCINQPMLIHTIHYTIQYSCITIIHPLAPFCQSLSQYMQQHT